MQSFLSARNHLAEKKLNLCRTLENFSFLQQLLLKNGSLFLCTQESKKPLTFCKKKFKMAWKGPFEGQKLERKDGRMVIAPIWKVGSLKGLLVRFLLFPFFLTFFSSMIFPQKKFPEEVAQMVSAWVCHTQGRGFDSPLSRSLWVWSWPSLNACRMFKTCKLTCQGFSNPRSERPGA